MTSFDPHALPVPDLGLRCLGCGYHLAGLPTHRCPECGRAFDVDEHIPRGDYPVVIFDGQEVLLTPEVIDLVRRYQVPFLESHGPIEAAYGLNRAVMNRSRLTVPRDRYFEVIDLLRRQAAGQPMPPPPDSQARPDWACDHCGEHNPGTFELCWQCGAPHVHFA